MRHFVGELPITKNSKANTMAGNTGNGIARQLASQAVAVESFTATATTDPTTASATDAAAQALAEAIAQAPNPSAKFSEASNGQPIKQQRPLLRWIILCVVAFLVLAGAFALTYWMISNASNISRDIFQQENSQLANTQSLQDGAKQNPEPTPEEKRVYEAIKAGADPSDPDARYLPTPLLASYGDLMVHTPILPKDITEIEFHQASYDTSLKLTPLVTIVDATAAAEAHGTNHTPFESQPFGEVPLIAEAVSTWRLNSVGDEMTAVDTGAAAGTYVYAPVSGTVVKIKQYSLYDEIDDFEVHIQSPDHPELDIVMLHIENLLVEVGDEVVGGATRMATVRNIGDIIDNNLSNFTDLDDPGNHCHVQVNNATREDYKGLEGALDIFDGKGYVR